MLKALPWKLGIVMFLCVFALGIACSDDSEPDIYGVTIEVSPDPIPAHIVDATFDVVFRPIPTRGKLDDENLGQGVYVIYHSKNLILLAAATPF
ncbi:MAG: hypothetical protein H8E48_14380, partial [Chloroflexi bacterium]|nr:hypothetical protein [Chloroflexota bacterium]